MNSELEYNKEPTIEYAREQVRQYNNANFSTGLFGSTQHAAILKEAAVIVPYFWECPEELIAARTLKHILNPVRNIDAVAINAAFIALTLWLSVIYGASYKFLMFQGAVSLIDYLYLDPAYNNKGDL